MTSTVGATTYISRTGAEANWANFGSSAATMMARCASPFQLSAPLTQFTITIEIVMQAGDPQSDNIVVEIRADNAGAPAATALTSASFASSTVSTDDYSSHTASFSYSLSASTTYWMVFSRTSPNPTYVCFAKCVAAAPTASTLQQEVGSSTWSTVDSNNPLSMVLIGPGGVSWPDHLNAQVGPFEYTRTTNALVLQPTTDATEFPFGRLGTGNEQTTSVRYYFADAATVTGCLFRIKKYGSPTGNINVELRGLSGGYPGPTLHASTSIAASQVTTTFKDYVVSFGTPYTVSAIGYAFCLSTTGDGPSSSDYYAIEAVNSDVNADLVTIFYKYTTGYGTTTSDPRFAILVSQSSAKSLYATLMDKANNTVEVWRSTDGGDTWAEADAAHHPSTNTSATSKSCYSQLVGDCLYVAYFDTTGQTIVRCFNCAVNLWMTPLPVALASGDVLQNVTTTYAVMMAVRSNNDVVLYYNGATQTVSGTPYRRVKYAIYSASSNTWTKNIDPLYGQLGTQAHYDVRSIALGGNGSVHFIFTQSNDALAHERHLKSDDTLAPVGYNTQGDLDISVTNRYEFGLSSGPFTVQGYKIVAIPEGYTVIGGTADGMTVMDNDTPSIGTAGLYAAAGERTNSNPGAAAYLGNMLMFMASVRDSDQHVVYNITDYTDAHYVAEGVSLITEAVSGISVGPLTNAVGVLYDAAGIVKFTKLSLSTPVSVTAEEARSVDQTTAPSASATLAPPNIEEFMDDQVIYIVALDFPLPIGFFN